MNSNWCKNTNLCSWSMSSVLPQHCAAILRQLSSQSSLPPQIHPKKLHPLLLKTTAPTSDPFFFNTLITLYAKSNLLTHARKIFDEIPQKNLFSWNAILSAYSKSSNLPEMENIFHRIPNPDGVSWNSLISGYIISNKTLKAIEAYKLMLRESSSPPNRITFSTLLASCSTSSSPSLGRQIHVQIIKIGFSGNPFVGSPLVDMYAKIGLIREAERVFEEMPEKNTVIYNTIITGFLRRGMVEEAKNLFFKMPAKDSISWTTLITGLIQNNLEEEALNVFQEMSFHGFSMDQYTFGSILTACGNLSAIYHGRKIHARIIRTDFLDNVFVGSALVDMYSKCERVKEAESVFKGMHSKNVVSWTAMLVGYGQNGFCEEAIRVFREMEREGVEPDDFTLGSVISSCGNLANLEEGSQLHSKAVVCGLTTFLTVSNAIITLYGKCGEIEDAQKIFDEMSKRDQVSWTALVSGYAQFGKAKETISIFEMMISEGIKPDAVTFIGVLSSCSRSGLVDKGKEIFNSMPKFGISPSKDHYTCMIDLFSRAGKLKEAENFIKQMPGNPDVIAWASLLSSCRIHRDLEMGRWAADSLMELDPQNPAGYVLLANMHASRGEWAEVAHVRKKMRVLNVKKEPGLSWIRFKNKVHVFSADDRSNPYSDQIYEKLSWLNERMMMLHGYDPDTRSVLHELGESEKIEMLSYHSEKLAIAFGLIFMPEGLPIRVVKNLRVCNDCHNATKLISKISRREILVRDSVRFHLFKNGSCSCGDFW